MSDPGAKEFKPYVSADTDMKELSLKALLLGIVMAVILGAANAYLGLKAGMTVAATFPAAVIAMAVLRPLKGTILEENIARTTGAVGEALAAGAIFTIPAFILTGLWTEFDYVISTALLLVGGVLGVFLVILLRRTFMEDKSLPFPESQACLEQHIGSWLRRWLRLVFAVIGLLILRQQVREIVTGHQHHYGFGVAECCVQYLPNVRRCAASESHGLTPFDGVETQ